MSNSTMFCASKVSNVYLVKVDPGNSRYHGFQPDSSGYLLTFQPNPGDKIKFVLPGRQDTYRRVTGLRSGEMIAWNYSLGLISESEESRYANKKKILISSHPGHSSMLGEDTWDDGVDQPILKDLIREAIGPFSDCDWSHAPVSISELDPGDSSLPSYLYYRITSGEGCVLISEEQHRRRDKFAIERLAKIALEEEDVEGDRPYSRNPSEEIDATEEEFSFEED